MGSIVKFRPKAKEISKEFRAMLDQLNDIKEDDLEGFCFYLKFKGDDENLTCFSPTWEMTGKLREFLNEINLELYIGSFAMDDSETSE